MSETVNLPALGESVTEGTVTRWLKQVGDEVAVDEPLLEVSTDKVDTEIPAPVSGTLLEITVNEDETVDVGAQLAVIGTGAAGGSAPAPAAWPARWLCWPHSAPVTSRNRTSRKPSPPRRSKPPNKPPPRHRPPRRTHRPSAPAMPLKCNRWWASP